MLNGAYAVAPDGKLVWNGFDGGVSEDGALFHAVEMNGQDVALFVGVPAVGGGAGSDALLGGLWRLGGFSTAFGSAVDRPEFCSQLAVVDADAAAASYSVTAEDSCADPLGESFSTATETGAYAVAPDGTLLVFDGGVPPGVPGAVNPAGTLAFVADLAEPGEIDLSVFVRRGELPTPFGVATKGTGDIAPTLASSGGFAYLGNPGFGFQLAQAKPGAQAFFGLTVQPGAGFPLFGGTVWIDPGTIILIQPLGVSGSGKASLSVAVPPTPALDGATVHAPAIVVDAGGPAGFALTAGLKIPLMR
jgi:hypothetical protein